MWFPSHMECPVCQTGQAVRVVKVDFKKACKEKELALWGFLPGEAFEAAAEAFRFWTFQKTLEYDWWQDEHGDLRLQADRLKQALSQRSNEAEAALHQLSQKGLSLFRELRNATSRRDLLQEEVSRARKRFVQNLEAAPDEHDALLAPKKRRPSHTMEQTNHLAGEYVSMKLKGSSEKSSSVWPGFPHGGREMWKVDTAASKPGFGHRLRSNFCQA